MKRRSRAKTQTAAVSGREPSLRTLVDIMRRIDWHLTRARDPDRLLTIEETAGLLRVSYETARRLIASGELRSVRLGQRRLVRVEDYTIFLEAHATRRPVDVAAEDEDGGD